MNLSQSLTWRYATKKFSSKKVDDVTISFIEEAIRMAPTSFGLQPFTVLRIDNKETREAIRALAYDQSQFTDASHLYFFVARTDIETRIEEYMQNMTGGSDEVRANLAGYESMMKGALTGLDIFDRNAWAAKQAYIALGFGLAQAAELSVDTCPMEGFDAKKIAELLSLPEHTQVHAALAVGYRDESDETANRPKVRTAHDSLFTVI